MRGTEMGIKKNPALLRLAVDLLQGVEGALCWGHHMGTESTEHFTGKGCRMCYK